MGGWRKCDRWRRRGEWSGDSGDGEWATFFFGWKERDRRAYVGISKEDFATVLTKAGFPPPAGTSVIQGWVQACKSGQPACQQGFNAMGAASAKTVTLDASGKANFPELPAGVYYVFVSSKYGSGHLLWNLRVELKPGGQALTLNERNAMAMQ